MQERHSPRGGGVVGIRPRKELLVGLSPKVRAAGGEISLRRETGKRKAKLGKALPLKKVKEVELAVLHRAASPLEGSGLACSHREGEEDFAKTAGRRSVFGGSTAAARAVVARAIAAHR